MVLMNKELTAIRRAVGGVAGLTATAGRRNRGNLLGLPVEIRSKAKGPTWRIQVVWLPEGWPSDVRAAVAGVPTPWPRNLVIAAPSLSSGALDELRARDANWADERSNVRLIVPPGLAVVSTPPPDAPPPPLPLYWTASAVAVVEVLLSMASGEHTLKEVAARSRCSIPKASNVIKALDRNGWTERRGPKRGPGVSWTIAKPGSMLDAWVDHLRKDRPVTRLGHRLMRDPATALVTDIAPLLGDAANWAVTGWAGLALTAPFLTQTPALQIYVAADRFDETAGSLFASGKIREVDTGANLELWRLDGPLIAHRHERGVPVINPARLYADLMALGGRGEDGARHLRETVVGY
jgi:hypothetical protein